MEVKGKIIKKMDLVTGVAKSTGNPWKKQDYVLETLDTYPKTIAFDFFGDRADQYNFEVGDVINLKFDIESREYQGRYYTNIRGFAAEKITEGAAAAPAQPQAPAADPYGAPAAPVQPDSFASSKDENDDLPF